MSSPEVRNLINEFLYKDFEVANAESVKTAVQLVQSIFIKATSMSLKLKRIKRKKKKENICNK